MLYGPVGLLAERGVNLDIVRFAADFLHTRVRGLDEGRHELRDGIYAIVKQYAPGDAATKRFETHVRYADVQFVLEGGETVLVAPREGLAVVEDRLAGDDVRFHAEPPPESIREVKLLGGDGFLLLLPEDAHKPECHCGFASGRKCIVKIPVGLLLGR